MSSVESRASSPVSPPAGELDLPRLADVIYEASRSLGFERRCRIGALVHQYVFGGSRLAFRARSGAAHGTFRQLALALHGKISKSELHRCVRTHLLVEDLPFVRMAQHITVSHVDVVDSLTRFEQRRLLQDASEHAWSVKELSVQKAALLASARAGGRRPGRPRRDGTQVALAKCREALSRLEEVERLVVCLNDTARPAVRAARDLALVIERASTLLSRIRGGVAHELEPPRDERLPRDPHDWSTVSSAS